MINIEQIEKQMDSMHSKFMQLMGNNARRIEEVATYRDSQNTITQLEDMRRIVGEMQNKITLLEHEIRALKREKIDTYEDEDLYELYKESGVTQKEIADKFNTSVQNANKMVNGKIQDLKIRHDLALFLIDKIKGNRK